MKWTERFSLWVSWCSGQKASLMLVRNGGSNICQLLLLCFEQIILPRPKGMVMRISTEKPKMKGPTASNQTSVNLSESIQSHKSTIAWLIGCKYGAIDCFEEIAFGKCTVFSRRILSKWARLSQWQVFFFFFRQTTQCMRSGHFLQNY